MLHARFFRLIIAIIIFIDDCGQLLTFLLAAYDNYSNQDFLNPKFMLFPILKYTIYSYGMYAVFQFSIRSVAFKQMEAKDERENFYIFTAVGTIFSASEIHVKLVTTLEEIRALFVPSAKETKSKPRNSPFFEGKQKWFGQTRNCSQ